jgi:hypothetical protein
LEDLGIWDLVSWANFKKADIGRFGNSMFGVAACQVEKWSKLTKSLLNNTSSGRKGA